MIQVSDKTSRNISISNKSPDEILLSSINASQIVFPTESVGETGTLSLRKVLYYLIIILLQKSAGFCLL